MASFSKGVCNACVCLHKRLQLLLKLQLFKVEISVRLLMNIVILSAAEKIKKFVKSFESSLKRQNSHYVLFVPRNETISLADMSFFDKVLKYATIALDVNHSENLEVKNMTLEDLRNQNIM